MDKQKKGQIVLAKNPRMTKQPDEVFDLIKSWGHQRFQALYLMMTQMFTDEELHDPDYCLAKLVVNSRHSQNDRLSAALNHSVPMPAPTPELTEIPDEPTLMDGIPDLEPEGDPEPEVNPVIDYNSFNYRKE